MKSLNQILFLLVFILLSSAVSAQKYNNFKVAVYCRAYEVEKMGDPQWLEAAWDTLSREVHVDKIYLETHRDLLIVKEETLKSAIKFFKGRGVQVSGGITYTIDESNNFQTFCYTNPENRAKVKEIAEYTARFFDEFILDDFFFTNCKCDLCIAAKGTESWTDYRLDLMKDAAVDLVINPAKKVNPNVEVVIKYPNWYEHFQGCGFNLEAEPRLFDAIYTGTETRDRSGNQHLQQYHGYSVFRYFENIKPGQNRGGWVDTGGMKYVDRYAEQLWLTMFAKAPEITLFDIRGMLYPIRKNTRAAWDGNGSTFSFDEMMKPIKQVDGSMFTPAKMSRMAGYSFEIVDKVLGALGKPVGIKSYRPYHSVGEDHLQSYLGMIGIPIEMVPEFPENEPIILLTETASYDTNIVAKIERQLKSGRKVVVTSGFYKAMEGKGIEDIVELRVTDRKALVKEFVSGWGQSAAMDKKILIPQISYITNDSWEVVSALDDTNGWPMLHRARYSTGNFYVLTVPDNFVDFYNLPEPTLNKIRQEIVGNLGVTLEGPGEVSLFVYDNNSFVVESFLDKEVTVNVVLSGNESRITDVASGKTIKGEMRKALVMRRRKFGEDVMTFQITLKPHSFNAFKF
nr:hypothetical protein [uncultured Draconibacterium sp.]